jgi:hypothetical protein
MNAVRAFAAMLFVIVIGVAGVGCVRHHHDGHRRTPAVQKQRYRAPNRGHNKGRSHRGRRGNLIQGRYLSLRADTGPAVKRQWPAAVAALIRDDLPTDWPVIVRACRGHSVGRYGRPLPRRCKRGRGVLFSEGGRRELKRPLPPATAAGGGCAEACPSRPARRGPSTFPRRSWASPSRLQSTAHFQVIENAG